MNWVRVLFLGDSLTAGSRDRHGLSWPYYLAHLALADGITVLPELCARPGWTSGNLVRAALPRISRSEATVGVILIGTNDAKDAYDTPLDMYLANLTLLANWLRIAGKEPWLVTVPLPRGFGSFGYSRLLGERLRQYNIAVRGSFGDSVIEAEDLGDYVDGVHFSLKGARAIAGAVWSALKRRHAFL